MLKELFKADVVIIRLKIWPVAINPKTTTK